MGGPQITSASAMNRLVDALNSLLNLSIVRGDRDRVDITDANTVLQIAGNPTSDVTGTGGTGTSVTMFHLKSVQGDYITCRTWNGSTDGATDVYLAKEYKLRESLTGETTPDGHAHTYSYGSGPDANNDQRADKDTVTGYVENQQVTPPWIVDEIVYGIQAFTGVTVGGNAVGFLLIGRSAHWGAIIG